MRPIGSMVLFFFFSNEMAIASEFTAGVKSWSAKGISKERIRVSKNPVPFLFFFEGQQKENSPFSFKNTRLRGSMVLFFFLRQLKS